MAIARDESSLPHETQARLEGRVLNRIFLGEHTEYRIAHEMLGEFMALSPRQAERQGGFFEIGDKVAAGWRPDAALALAKT